MDLIGRTIAGRLDRLAPQARRALVLELFRQLRCWTSRPCALAGLAHVPGLQATLSRRRRLATGPAARRGRQDHLARVARAWELMAGLLGFRLRAESGITWQTLAAPVSATMRGLVMTALTMPGIAGQTTVARPFEAPEAGEWSLPALGLGAVGTAFLEPDPKFTWDAGRAAAIRDALTRLATEAEPPGEAAIRSE